MALELGPHNIRVSAVQPTVVMTSLGKAFCEDDKRASEVKKRVPLGRFAGKFILKCSSLVVIYKYAIEKKKITISEIEEVVDTVVYLLSEKSSMVTGSGILVDGGFFAS